MRGEQYLGNTSKKQVHDLDNEQTGANECQVDEIIRAGNDSRSRHSHRHTHLDTPTATTVCEWRPRESARLIK
jgi:5-deoxy-D-glucuronate isomerase